MQRATQAPQFLLCKKQAGRLRACTRIEQLLTTAVPFRLSKAHRSCKGVPRLQHFVLLARIVFRDARHRHPVRVSQLAENLKGFALESSAEYQTNRVLQICCASIDPQPLPAWR